MEKQDLKRREGAMVSTGELKRAHAEQKAASNRAQDAAYDSGPYIVQDVNEQGIGSYLLLKNYPFELEKFMPSSEYNLIVKGLNDTCGNLAAAWGASLQKTIAGGLLTAVSIFLPPLLGLAWGLPLLASREKKMKAAWQAYRSALIIQLDDLKDVWEPRGVSFRLTGKNDARSRMIIEIVMAENAPVALAAAAPLAQVAYAAPPPYPQPTAPPKPVAPPRL
jgi:hypothetical protein